MKYAHVLAAFAGLAVLAGCGGDQAGSGGVTAEEARQLNEAAEMVDVSSDSLVAGDNAMLGNGEEPSAEAADQMVMENMTAPATDGAAVNAQ
jgi:hypothetical protein